MTTSVKSFKRILTYAAIGLAGVGFVWFVAYQLGGPASEPGRHINVQIDDWAKGNKDAQVTLVEYLDFECEACGAYYPVVKQLEAEFGDRVRFVSRYFPLPGHKNSMTAASAVEAAGRQGKFWEMHDTLFENQKAWAEKSMADPKLFLAYAQKIGLDMAKYQKDVNDSSLRDRIERDKRSGEALGIQGTPSFFLNGEKISNPRSYEEFKTLISAELLKTQAASLPPKGEKVHEHADFKVYLNGQAFDFKPPKFQSSKENPLDPDAHLHDGNGDVTHKHRKGITLAYFFKSLGMTFDQNCFIDDQGARHCNEGDKKLKLYVNGKSEEKLGDYEFSDLDRILISYGSENDDQVKTQLDSVTDMACLYSEKCPERGKPPTESCVGGLGEEC